LKEDFHGLIFIFIFVWVLYESWERKNRGLVGSVGKEKEERNAKKCKNDFCIFCIACGNDVFYFLSFYKLKEQYARSFYEIRYSLCQLSRPKEKEEHN